MRFRWLPIGVTLLTGLFASLAHGATTDNYQEERNSHSVVRPEITGRFVRELPKMAGQVIELDGTVSSMIPKSKANSFYLQVSGKQHIAVTNPSGDPDVKVGDRVRVLASVSGATPTLQMLAVTPIAQAAVGDEDQVGSDADAEFITMQDESGDAEEMAPGVLVSYTGNSLAEPGSANGVKVYAEKIRTYNRAISAATATTIATHVLSKSRKYGVDPRLVFALIAQESRFNPRAVSPMGARGLGQLMPGTARLLGVRNSFDIAQNVDGTIRYLKDMLVKFKGNVRYALAAYNAGPGNVTRFGGVPPFAETQNYVRRISANYEQLSSGGVL